MGRILAIDYGSKRAGIAVTDSLQIIANSLTTVESPVLIDFLTTYFSKEKVEMVVIGLPKQMDNSQSESMPAIEKFVGQFKLKFPEMPIVYFDERFTSKLAVQALIMGGAKKKDRQNKALIDTVSATIILQSYMESRKS